MKKIGVLFIASIFLFSLNLVSAINLDISSEAISNKFILSLNEPAKFELTIRNLGDTEEFEIYSLAGIDIIPNEKITINSGETKKIKIIVTPQESLKSRKGFLNFEYRIKDEKNNIQKETLTINIIELLKINSAFFDFEEKTSFSGEEEKEFEIKLDKEKIKTLSAGNFLLNTQIQVKKETAELESIIKFLEQEDIETIKNNEGWIIKRTEISKKNLGNIKKKITITAKKNLFSYLFTTFNIAPTKIEFSGLSRRYIWEKELIPNEEFNLIIKTNWFYPIIIILLITGLIVFIKKSIESDLILRKRVSFIKTKGGQFALKVSLKLKSKNFIEKINIIDKLPPLVKLYERFGAIIPDKIDLKNKRLEWNVESLNKGEERIFTYIIYSKIGVVGRFELPSAKAIYEKEGKVKKTESNRSFFINEPKNKIN